MGGVDESGLPTLYEWAGGLDPLRRMIDSFYDRVEADDALSGLFPGGVSQRHREHVTDWWAEVLGGPTTYTDRHGGYESMLRHHVGLDITAAQRHRFATTMSLAADDADLPADPEFRAAFEARPPLDPPAAALASPRGGSARAHLPMRRSFRKGRTPDRRPAD